MTFFFFFFCLLPLMLLNVDVMLHNPLFSSLCRLPSVEFCLEVSTAINPGYLQFNRPIVFSASMMWHLQSTAPSRFWQRGSQVFILSHILCFLTQMCLILSSPLAGVLLPGMAFISATKDAKWSAGTFCRLLHPCHQQHLLQQL